MDRTFDYMTEEQVKWYFDMMERKLTFLGSSAPAICRYAANRGTAYLAKRMRELAPVASEGRRVNGKLVKPGGMKRSIRNRAMRTTGSVVAAKAGLDVGRRKDKGLKPMDSGGHGHWFVQGTDHRFRSFKRVRYGRKAFEVKARAGATKRNGWTGRAPAHHPSFIRTATDAAAPEVWRIVIEELHNKIEAVALDKGIADSFNNLYSLGE